MLEKLSETGWSVLKFLGCIAVAYLVLMLILGGVSVLIPDTSSWFGTTISNSFQKNLVHLAITLFHSIKMDVFSVFILGVWYAVWKKRKHYY
ncbi:hypothetical protein PP175_29040 (plasmid) [Aneurinibacillus sp. Ricciae_BoGa-3]|uniref:hypothetical protein n=1 Tax=Aneurinibacillus sp. Ricciae_BoGa-3 TaxID=3022697 RepID=UPI002340A5A4|nr:hypothetical protein [Aneurinibacillus sp. Ricciae_BoGa-3]WCK57238.1 hypothetical protein PP175_29040 [Aneurinibacillus sp. Ricciae_BoGa-3]